MTTSNIAAPERLLSPPGKAAVRLALAVDADDAPTVGIHPM